ncbi:MAG: GNAT family N-acetyltransferase [Firmicutes bacterium]|nr:GNAT family N-acetyltransferase [Bacillota bacterium]
MKFVWQDYNHGKHKSIDGWHSPDIDKFAMFNEPLSAQAEWYQKNKLGKDIDFIKVVLLSEKIVAFLILNKSDGEVGINPIVVNPRFVDEGHGKKIMQDLITNYSTILNCKVDKFTANISLSNTVSIRFFESLGFKFEKLNEDKNFASYTFDS